ncbi:ABC transporter permease [Rothia sp. ZJ1223]|uniref:ABC transporter permease n=1 Tax=Rothia sp. ZJ1223 TaxID=2811098 RepID=UPI001EF703CD|nr:ABC transporter permease subunit [Rothia sp. ZJ1223]
MPRAALDRTLMPRWFFIPVAVALVLTAGPLLGLMLQVPWSNLGELLTAPGIAQATTLSVTTALVSTAVCIALGVPLSLWIARVLPRSRHSSLAHILHAVVYAPVVLSPVVSGLALVYFWGRRGLLGSVLAQGGINIAFTPLAVVLAQVFVALPFFVATYMNVLRTVPVEYEEIALTEGASPWHIIIKVLLPLTLPGLATAALLSFARALGEFGATLMFAGNLEGKTRTLPLNIELMLSSADTGAALGSALVMIALYLLLGALFALGKVMRRKA